MIARRIDRIPDKIIAQRNRETSAPKPRAKAVDEVDDVVEATTGTGSDAASANGDGQMGLAGAGAADQGGIALLSDEASAGEIIDQGLVDGCALELEVVEVLGKRQLGDGELVLDRSGLLLVDLGVEQSPTMRWGFLHNVKLLRQWAGVTDMTPDYTPIMGASPFKNYWLDCGWGTWGFKATPVAGKYMAETVAKERAADILLPFSLDRFEKMALINEMGATAASH